MPIHDIQDLLQGHGFFSGLDPKSLAFIAGCGTNVMFRANDHLFHEGGPADRVYVVRSGRVALELHAPDRGLLMVDTVGESGIVGASWLFPPYRWELDARAMEEVHAVQLDAICLRAKCDEDPRLGYELMKRLAEVMRSRMQSARLRLLDLYGHSRAG